MSMKMSEEIEYIEENSLSIPHDEETSLVEIEKNIESVELKKKIKDDFTYARQNIKTIIDTGMIAVENLAVIASQTELPRAFECLATLLQINALNNSMLLDFDYKMQDLIDGKLDENGPNKVVNNNTLFVASTTDIQRMIEENIKGNMNNGQTT